MSFPEVFVNLLHPVTYNMSGKKYGLALSFPFLGGVITRHHEGVQVLGLVEILPTGLPELFRPSGTSKSFENYSF